MNIATRLSSGDSSYYLVSHNNVEYQTVCIYHENDYDDHNETYVDRYYPVCIETGEEFSRNNPGVKFDSLEDAAEALVRLVDQINFDANEEDKIK